MRADFDDAGLHHVNAVLAGAPGAAVWRMGAADYLDGLDAAGAAEALRVERLPDTPWDPRLRDVMAARGVAVYEEALLDVLVADVGAGPPSASPPGR